MVLVQGLARRNEGAPTVAAPQIPIQRALRATALWRPLTEGGGLWKRGSEPPAPTLHFSGALFSLRRAPKERPLDTR